MRKLLFLYLILITCTIQLPAKMLDGIAVIVEGDAITIAEINAVRSQMHVSKAKAIDVLIQDRLQNIAMKDIVIKEEEIDQKVSEIAAQNKLTIPKMQQILKAQGTPWITFRKNIREGLKKVHFFQEVIASFIPEPTNDELKLFYNKHKDKFTIPKTIKMIEYSASSQKELEAYIKLYKRGKVKTKTILRGTKTLGVEMLSMLLQTPKNTYTKILNTGNTFISYKVLSTKGKTIMPFNIAEMAVASQWKRAQQDQAIKDYFEKQRARADIRMLR